MLYRADCANDLYVDVCAASAAVTLAIREPPLVCRPAVPSDCAADPPEHVVMGASTRFSVIEIAALAPGTVDVEVRTHEP